MPSYISGDTAPFLVSLTKSGVPFACSETDTIKAAFTTGSALITAAVTQSPTASGAAWASGIIGVAFDSTNADLLAAHAGSVVSLEVQVDQGVNGKQSFQADYQIVRGVIP